MTTPQPRWEIDKSMTPPSFLPAWLDRSELIDITFIGDAFRRYIDPSTGTEHVGADYYAAYCREVEKL